MPIEITMPRLSDTMEQGTVVSWNVKEGDEVNAGDVLGDIETDKATMELQNFDDGTVASILLEEGQTVEVGSLIMVLAEEDEDVEDVKAQYAGGAPKKSGTETEKAGKDEVAEKKKQQGGKEEEGKGGSTAVAEPEQKEAEESKDKRARGGEAAPAPEDRNGRGGRIFASPLAKKVAEEKGVDLSALQGSGPSGRIIKRDVEAAAEGAPAKAPERPDKGVPVTPIEAAEGGMQLDIPSRLEAQTVQLSNMRRTIAQRLQESKQTIPHYQVTVSISMDSLLELRERLNEQLAAQNVKLSVNDFLVRACALAMHQHPFVNSSWGEDGQSIVTHEAVNIGVAVALPAERGGGLVVATLRNADRMTLRQISSRTKALAKKAREKGLTIEEMSDSTFTISNLGMYGVEHFNAIINPPNSAILAVGAAMKKPVVRDNELTIGHEMQMTMSSDHRVIDGAMAAEYLSTVRSMLEAPATLLV